MKLIEEVELSNGLVLKIFDATRSIAKDTVKVEISFQTRIALEESYFSDAGDYGQVRKFMGDELTYEHKLERSFVYMKEEDSTRTELISTFKKNSLNYLSSPGFPRKMALSTLRDIRNNPYKYQSRVASDPEE
ncbi:MAG: hypothetical protein QMD11_07545 [Smithella sp.]|nr:hypothetical protein [Smithella sp.]